MSSAVILTKAVGGNEVHLMIASIQSDLVILFFFFIVKAAAIFNSAMGSFLVRIIILIFLLIDLDV